MHLCNLPKGQTKISDFIWSDDADKYQTQSEGNRDQFLNRIKISAFNAESGLWDAFYYE
jgi:hypothetical protein